MRITCNLFKTATFTTLAALLLPVAAQADMHGDGKMDHQKLRERAVSAEQVLSGDVQHLTNPVGNVRDLILNEAGTAVEYVLYEVPFPYYLEGARNGFVRFDNVAVELDATTELVLRFDEESAAHTPDELTITRAEADHRMVSRILEDAVTFSDAARTHEVEDMLIDRETGEILGYVVNRNPDSWFNDQPAMIPPQQVSIGPGGNVTTGAEIAALESLK